MKKMKNYADRCLIYYEEGGVKKSWAVSAMPGKDNDETLKTHLKKWKPNAEYIGHKFSPTELSTFEQMLKAKGKLP